MKNQTELENQMCLRLHEKFLNWKKCMKENNLNFILTSVARNYKEQIALFIQGRELLPIVNKYRTLAELYSLYSDKENIVVTWSMNSKHIINLYDDIPENNKSRAFDFALLTEKDRPHWNLKININLNLLNDYREAAKIAEKCGLISGYHFKIPDYCHIEI